MLVILNACMDVKDGICTTVCPVDCIYEGERMYYIHPSECIECGVCESICPVDAIRFNDELGDDEKVFEHINAEAFRAPNGEIDHPGGWHRGMTPRTDPPELDAWLKKEDMK